MVYVLTKKASTLNKTFPKNTIFVSLPLKTENQLQNSDLFYIDISGLTSADLKKTLTQIKKRCKDISWGIIDVKGSCNDPASLFFDGACDYLGPSFLKGSKTIDAKRIKEALQWRNTISAVTSDSKAASTTESAFLKSGIKLPAASAFPGWKKMESGKAMPFYLLYCSLQGKELLDSRLGEKVLNQVNKRFLSILVNNLNEADGLPWMDSGKDYLFLLPPKAQCANAAIKACIKMIISTPLHVIETIGLNLPANFKFALHYGSINYKPPGKTGTVVSDAVNSIFHLGAKKAEAGRLTITSDLPDVSIPKVMQDFFVPCGEYEGRNTWHTKKFVYAKPWV